jgi:hypothetical protein
MFEDLKTIFRGCGTCQKMHEFPKKSDFYKQFIPERNLELKIDHVGPFVDMNRKKLWVLNVIEMFPA